MATAETWDVVNAIAQTVSAIGTTGALLVAARVYRQQVNDKRQEQASLVALMRDGDAVVLVNFSPLPISNIEATRRSRSAARAMARSKRRRHGPEVQCTDLPPGGQLGINIGSMNPVDHPDPRGSLLVSFTDSGGRRWTRIGRDGSLRTGSLYPLRWWQREKQWF